MFQGKHPAVSTYVKLEGQTVFTRRVLDAAMEISWGETRSYCWVARRIGKPGAARAVGQALGRNPVPLMIPCHRVINKDGSLGGFGQGTDWKEWLLEIERGGKGL
ncbi:MAG: methylated-DNA--[protein]-cysteine S-methyltransferase [Actinobacteria bacterium]|nr:methylated-DNA--[protein]-cysteine S-methyltransferase [Actinomycetota bacterium]